MKNRTLLSLSALSLAMLATNSMLGKEVTRITDGLKHAQFKSTAKRTLYTEQLSKDAVNKWNNAVKAVRNLAEKQNDKDLMKPMQDLDNENNKLINGIKITYSTVFAQAPGIAWTGTEMDLANRRMEFENIKKRVEEIEAKINQSRFFLPGKQDAKEAMLYLATKLKETATTARKDIDAEIKRIGS